MSMLTMHTDAPPPHQDGAYTRTALGQLSYAILILRLFEKDFYWCGCVDKHGLEARQHPMLTPVVWL